MAVAMVRVFVRAATVLVRAKPDSEQTHDSKGKAVDFWSLGCVLFEMLQGFSPFVGDDANDTMAICHRITRSASYIAESRLKPNC